MIDKELLKDILTNAEIDQADVQYIMIILRRFKMER